MKKKSEISVLAMIGIALGVFAVFVIIFFIVGPDQLLAKGLSAAKLFGLGKLPEETIPTFTGGSSIPDDILNSFNSFVNLIETNRAKVTETRCLIPLNQYPKPGNNYYTVLSLGTISLRLKKGQEYGITSGNFKSFPGFEPCIVAETTAAEKFFNNWLDGSIENTYSPEYTTAVNGLIIVESENKLRMIYSGNNKEYDILNENGKRFLYKIDNYHFCFMPYWNDLWDDSCTRPTGDNILKGLDSDCFTTYIPKVIPECGASWPGLDYNAYKCNVDKSTCRATNLIAVDGNGCRCFNLGNFQTRGNPDRCDTSRPYCYDRVYGCSNEVANTGACRQSLGNDYVSPPKCIIDSTCRVTNIPCLCDTAGSRDYPSTTPPETCTNENPYCIDGRYGCEDTGLYC